MSYCRQCRRSLSSRSTLALSLFVMIGWSGVLRADISDRPTALTESDWAGPRLSDWPGPRALQHLPEGGRDETRRLSDEIRGTARGPGCDGPVALAVLAPPYTGVTISTQPTLYWFIGSDVSAEIEVELYDEASPEPVLSTTLADGQAAGIHGLNLADQGVSLALDVEYEWSVAVICDPRDPSADAVSTGTIRRIIPPRDLQRRLETASLREDAALLVEHGIWYDALEALATLTDEQPRNAVWATARARLLEQVGLDQAAAYGR